MFSGKKNTSLFSATLLDSNKFPESKELVVRPLAKDDYEKGFLTCLENLTVVGEVSKKQFLDNFKIIQKHGEHFTIVVEDISKKKIVACGSVVVEHKFTHGCGRIGHIEDIVCSEEYRGKHLGKCVIEQLKHIARGKQCYKVILDCNEPNQGFYEKLDFKRKEVQMAHYFEH